MSLSVGDVHVPVAEGKEALRILETSVRAGPFHIAGALRETRTGDSRDHGAGRDFAEREGIRDEEIPSIIGVDPAELTEARRRTGTVDAAARASGERRHDPAGCGDLLHGSIRRHEEHPISGGCNSLWIADGEQGRHGAVRRDPADRIVGVVSHVERAVRLRHEVEGAIETGAGTDSIRGSRHVRQTRDRRHDAVGCDLADGMKPRVGDVEVVGCVDGHAGRLMKRRRRSRTILRAKTTASGERRHITRRRDLPNRRVQAIDDE